MIYLFGIHVMSYKANILVTLNTLFYGIRLNELWVRSTQSATDLWMMILRPKYDYKYS